MSSPIETVLDAIEARAPRFRLLHEWREDGDLSVCDGCGFRVHKDYEGMGLNPICKTPPDVPALVAALRVAVKRIHDIGHAEGYGPVLPEWDCPSHARECREAEAAILALLTRPTVSP